MYKGVSYMFILKEFRIFYKFGRSLLIISFGFSKRFGRISFFLRNVRVNFIIKVVGIIYGRDVDIMVKMVERSINVVIVEIVEGG